MARTACPGKNWNQRSPVRNSPPLDHESNARYDSSKGGQGRPIGMGQRRFSGGIQRVALRERVPLTALDRSHFGWRERLTHGCHEAFEVGSS